MNIITQNLKNVIKNRIKNKIFSITNNIANEIIENFFSSETKYLPLIISIEEKTRLLIRDIIVATIEEIDAEYTVSAERENCAYINKRNVSRTIVTATALHSLSHY